MPVFLLIRHGEHSLLPRRLAGRMPGVHLNERGLQQATALAETLSAAPIRAVFSSPMERAVETAAPLAEKIGLPLEILPGITELDYGRWMGRTFKQLKRIKLWKVLHDTPSQVRFPGGETLMEAQGRGVEAVRQVAAQYEDKDLLSVFTHGDMVRLIMAHFLDIPLNSYQRLGVDPASISVVVINQDGSIHVPRLNQVLDFRLPPPEK